MERTLTCISCPVGCRMKVIIKEGEVVSLSGNACKRGEVYAKQESLAPKRMVTAVVSVKGSKMPLSVKTQEPVDKNKIKTVMNALSLVEITAPITMGQVIVKNVAGTGVDIIATKPIKND